MGTHDISETETRKGPIMQTYTVTVAPDDAEWLAAHRGLVPIANGVMTMDEETFDRLYALGNAEDGTIDEAYDSDGDHDGFMLYIDGSAYAVTEVKITAAGGDRTKNATGEAGPAATKAGSDMTTTDLVQAIDYTVGVADHPGATLDLTTAFYYTTADDMTSILCRADGSMVARGETPTKDWYWVHNITNDMIAIR